MFKITKRRIIALGLVLLLLGGFGWRRMQAAKTKQAMVKTTAVEAKKLTEIVTSSGKTKALQQVDLHFQTLGRLAWVGVAEGDHVEAYTVLATLDQRELEKNLEKALRDYSKERNDFEEDRLLTYKDDVFTDTIKRILEKNQWDLEKAVLDVELKSIAREWATLVTPISGVVTNVDTPVAGVNITSTNTFTVADLSSIIFSGNIDESDIGKVEIGQTAEIHLDAYADKTFTGKVTKIAYAAETSSGGTSVYPVEITFDMPEELRIGLNGDLSIIISEQPDALSVPLEAVREDASGTRYVIVKTAQGFERKDITTGIETDLDSEIVSGVAVGDMVVTEGFAELPKELTAR